MNNESCKAETYKHIFEVAKNLNVFISEILERGQNHDSSKLIEPELSGFAVNTEKLSETNYGTKEYQNLLSSLDDTIKHHHANNRHHPEHFKNGVEDMDLVDIVEMLCDWKAASERTKNGNIFQSIDYNSSRFGINNQLRKILENTIHRYFP